MGAAADVKGAFSLRIPASKATLVASYMGYKSQEYKVNGTGRIEVRLIADSKVLNDVVVTGIVNRKKKVSPARLRRLLPMNSDR
ncbi:carboxypeptidase-like regulatory domain-containing protein [Chitinophaga sedimenti]|uniref:carboxypeptidase-like regulatory domain-containing protein n=1 Tax=Chitinophaga sedimenti TaxID=2033606 RepID=UPI002005E076|nr:carboxypeptidase-like regulatory domain-containing protein [Chitinophaga sedimenti]MCK7554833.1 carboxypeptidase-like regulatory domain-containing protein [Chitinophaga sedimenti]